MTEDAAEDIAPSRSRGGRWIYFESNRSCGRWILYTQEDRADMDIMLVENFR